MIERVRYGVTPYFMATVVANGTVMIQQRDYYTDGTQLAVKFNLVDFEDCRLAVQIAVICLEGI